MTENHDTTTFVGLHRKVLQAAVNLNGTDRITIIYNFILVVFVFVFRARITGYPYHLAFNVSVILIILLLSFRRKSSWPVRAVIFCFPFILYALLYYQTGLINRVVVSQFLDGFFMNLDVRIFGEFPGFFLRGKLGNPFFDEFFHFFYLTYYLIMPLTGILLFRKGARLFDGFVFQLSALFYVCFLIFVFLPVEGPITVRNEYFHQGGPFQTIVDLIWAGGENPGAAFPSSHVAATFLVAWWGSAHFKRLRIFYWLTFVFLSIATVYCMFHYAVDVIGGLLLAILAVATFSRIDKKHHCGEGPSEEHLKGNYSVSRLLTIFAR